MSTTTTYVSAVIMRDVSGEERDEMAQAIEDLNDRRLASEGYLEEVYLPVGASVGASDADMLRHAAYRLILQAEELDERAADVEPPTHANPAFKCHPCHVAGRPYDEDRHDSENCWAG